MTYSPAQASDRTGLSIDTLRYYERTGLLAPVRRNGGGRREYSDGDLAWLGVVQCLRGAGMGIGDIRSFTELLRGGDTSHLDRVAMLQQHRATLLDHIAQMHSALKVIDDKIAYYSQQSQAS